MTPDKPWFRCSPKKKMSNKLHVHHEEGSLKDAKGWRKYESFKRRFAAQQSRHFDFLLSLFWKNRRLFKVQIVGLREEGAF